MISKSTRLSAWMVPLLLVAFCPAVPNAAAQMGMHKKASETVTGCLQKGDEPSGFTLTGEDGKVWELHSTKTNLADHIGHTVTVTGSSTKLSKAKEEAIETSETKETTGKDHGDLLVTRLKKVSDTCK